MGNNMFKGVTIRGFWRSLRYENYFKNREVDPPVEESVYRSFEYWRENSHCCDPNASLEESLEYYKESKWAYEECRRNALKHNSRSFKERLHEQLTDAKFRSSHMGLINKVRKEMKEESVK